jgi:hypothetical protein
MDLLGAIKNKIQGGVDNVQQKAAGVVDNFKDAGKAFEHNLAKPMTINKIGPRAYDETMAKYSMASHMYPNDLLSQSYAGNYAVFYINVSDESKLFTPEETVELDPKVEKRYRSKFVGGSINTAGVVGAAAAVNIGGGMVKGTINTVAGNKGKDSKDKSSVLGGALGGAGDQLAPTIGLGFAAQQAPKSYRLQRRLKTAIALHVPNQLSVRYGTQWGEEDTAAVQAIYDAGSSAFAAAAQEKGGLAKMAGAAGAVTGVGTEAMANYGLSKANNAGAVSAAMGIAANPKKEQTFKGVDFRKFTFDYQFYPRSAAEARNVLNIIETFKLHMHPEFKSELNYIWIYPSEFDIIYYTNHTENLNLHRHTSCVLEELSVNYTPNGVYSTFENGMPTQINISMSFKELQILSKETVKEGL